MTKPKLRSASFAAVIALALGAPLLAAEKDLSKTPQAKAHEAQLKALNAGDYEAYRKTVTKANLEQMDKEIKESGMDAKKAMEFLKEMAPQEIKYTGLKVEGRKPRSWRRAKSFDQVNYGNDRARGGRRQVEDRPAELDDSEEGATRSARRVRGSPAIARDLSDSAPSSRAKRGIPDSMATDAYKSRGS